MWCLSAQDLSKGDVAQPERLAPPAREQLHEASGLRGEPRAAPAARTTALRDQHFGAEDPLHLADAVQAGAIAPTDLLPGRPNRAAALDGVEEAQVARPHQERAVPVEPQLVTRLEVRAERGAAGRGHTRRDALDYAPKASPGLSNEPIARRHRRRG